MAPHVCSNVAKHSGVQTLYIIPNEEYTYDEKMDYFASEHIQNINMLHNWTIEH
jgi:hypothetical protein